jgi:hypothetical protein
MPWLLVAATFVIGGCGTGPVVSYPAIATPSIVNLPSSTATGTPASTPTATPTEAAITSTPADYSGALALGGNTPVRSAPSMDDGSTVRTLADRQPVKILGEVRGQRWVVGDQTWAMAIQDWTNVWYKVAGGYVYAGFVYVPRPGEADALLDRGGAHWVDVDLNAQTATAMVGDRSVHMAAATTGKPGFDTPAGEHSVQYRKFNETMTSTQAAIQDPNEQYDVKNVLYTQYFDATGDALHLNYWQPDGVFGRQRSSHGCVGLELHDAQFFWLFTSSGSRVSIHPQPSSTPTPTSTPTVTATATSTASAPATATATATAGTPPAASQDPGSNERFSRATPTVTIPPPPPPPVFQRP